MGWMQLKYIIYMYGSITMKPFHTTIYTNKIRNKNGKNLNTLYQIDSYFTVKKVHWDIIYIINRLTHLKCRICRMRGFFCLFCFVFSGTGVWTQDSSLQSRSSTFKAHLHFALVILEMGVLQTIFPDWPWTVIFLISASKVAGIKGVSQWCLAKCNSF
jgi:hypothetical protein